MTQPRFKAGSLALSHSGRRRPTHHADPAYGDSMALNNHADRGDPRDRAPGKTDLPHFEITREMRDAALNVAVQYDLSLQPNNATDQAELAVEKFKTYKCELMKLAAAAINPMGQAGFVSASFKPALTKRMNELVSETAIQHHLAMPEAGAFPYFEDAPFYALAK